MDEKKTNRISNLVCVALVAIALVCDLIGLIPFAKDFIGPLFWIGVSFYLWTKGMGMFNSWPKVAAMGLDLIASMIPAIQELPELTLGIVVIIILIRFEDKTGMSLVKPLQGKITAGNAVGSLSSGGTRLPPPKQPLNSGGVRSPQEQDDLDPETVKAFRNYAAENIKDVAPQGLISGKLEPNKRPVSRLTKAVDSIRPRV